MRLLFNATNLRSQGGVLIMRHLLPALLAEWGDLQVLLYVNPQVVPALPAFGERVQVVPCRPEGYVGRFLWEQITLPGLIRKRQVDTLLSFGNTGPRYPGCRQILYVHQSIPYADYRPARHRWRWRSFQALYGWLIGLAQRGSERIVVPTGWLVEPMRRSIRNAQPASAYVISPPGLPDFDSGSDLSIREAGLLDQVRHWRESGEAILLYPCYLAPYKNIPFLLEAMAHLKSRTDRPFRLLLTFNRQSPEYFPCKAEVLQALERLGLEGRQVELVGELSRQALSVLYPMTDVLTFPSLVETLGLPLLEAMAFGVPVAALHQTGGAQAVFAHEICGDAALYAEPGSVTGFAAIIQDLLENDALRKSLSAAAKSRSGQYSWQGHAAEILG